MLFFLDNLWKCLKSVSLQCVFHSIRFKVNKGWSTAVLLFLCLYFSIFLFYEPVLPFNFIDCRRMKRIPVRLSRLNALSVFVG